MSAPFTIHGSVAGTPVVATAIHAGHDLRPEVASLMRLEESVRLREEDPHTDRIALAGPQAVVAHRSRFEVDLNRTRASSIYERPEDAWGLDLWSTTPDARIIERSREEHDAFYDGMRQLLDPLASTGSFVVLDIHSYNHRRDGAASPPAPPVENPDVNVGTGTVDRAHWGNLIDWFVADLGTAEVAGHQLDVRENVRFKGGYFASWVHEEYAGVGCALALEFKKTFMDEWTGAVDDRHLTQLTHAAAATISRLPVAMETVA